MTTRPLVERLSFRDSDHTYFLDGKRIPSVTTILGNLSAPALIWWSANEGAKAVQEYFDEQADMLTDSIELTADELRAMGAHTFELARTAHTKKKNTAAKKGSVVHDAIQQYHENFFDAQPPDADVEPHAHAAWEAFVAWWGDAGLTCISTERKIVGQFDSDEPGNVLTYSGRLDMLCEDDTKDLFVCDIKTSNGVYAPHIIQNAAYAHALEQETEQEVAGTKVIWLPHGCEKATILERDRDEWQRDLKVFRYLLEIHGYRRGMKKWLDEVKQQHAPLFPAE